MHANKRIILVTVIAFICLIQIRAAVAQPGRPSPLSTSNVIQLSAESSFLDFDSIDRSVTLRQSTTPVHLTVTGAVVTSLYPIEIYVSVTSETAMRLAGKLSTLSTSSLRIRNDRGVWAELAPLPELEGRFGVRIAVVTSSSATVLLQVQLKVPPGQAPGNYQGTMTVEAQ
jgi:hypothetical protein